MINKIGNPQEEKQIIVNSKEMGYMYPTDMKTVNKNHPEQFHRQMGPAK